MSNKNSKDKSKDDKPNEISNEQAMRYARHIMLADFDIDKQALLISSKVLVVGLGGLGCAASQYLAAAGAGRLTLVDDDKVELTNLQRQVIHFEHNLGQTKVASAKSTLQDINSDIELVTLDKRLDETQLKACIKQHDLVLDCTDNLESRKLINQLCYDAQKPLVSGAAIRMEGQIFCVDPKQSSACYECFSHRFGQQNLSCVESGVMSPLVGIVGAYQALEAIKLLCNYGQAAINTLQLFDAMSSSWQQFTVNKREDCQVCISKAPSCAAFDNYVGIDWSGAKSPKYTNAIALAHCNADSASAPLAINKKLSREDVFDYICKLAQSPKRSLVGIDCNFGYCLKVGKKQFGEATHYSRLWDEVEDLNQQHGNFFAGEFWQSPFYEPFFWTSGKQPSWFDAEKLRRETETCAAKQGLGTPESPFKLIGAKQVGKGGLAGMRLLVALKKRFGQDIAIWPFEHELCKTAKVVISEIYPRLFIRRAGFGNGKIRDYRALDSVLSYFNQSANNTKHQDEHTVSDHLSDAIIASAGLKWFCTNSDVLCTDNLPDKALAFEGWIFGVEP